MTKVSFASAILLASIIGTTAVATTAHAQDFIPGVQPATYDSHGVITFQASTTTNPIIDPEIPTNPITVTPVDPELPPNPGTAGPLTIDFASTFQFGTQAITSQTMNYQAAAQPTSAGDRSNFVQVTDNRGTLAGWDLKAKATDFTVSGTTNPTGTGQTLKGAVITLGDLHHVSASDASQDAVVSAGGALTPGADLAIMNAVNGAGAGTHVATFGTNATDTLPAVTLNVPGATTKLAAKYVSTITWTLSELPVAP
ncbi:MAG: WxL domain-containing protein [Streptococcaceae bacterium]|jgi:hypothetical protein|nr:WxL domain-containing protein [Streptococcaceae bacterium]